MTNEPTEFEKLYFDPKGLPDGMTNERYESLMWSEDNVACLSEDELKKGWHFCDSWDGLLIHPAMMDEYGVCLCGHRTEVPK